MPDKYSYKSTAKKKKAVRKPIATQTAGSSTSSVAAEENSATINPVTISKNASITQSESAAKPVAAQGEARGITKVANLGAELRRLLVVSALIVIVLVVASMVLK